MVSYRLPTAHERRGGIERAAHTLAEGLARRGHDVTVFTHDPRPEGAAYDVNVLPWQRFVNTWVGRRATMGYLGNLLAILPDYRDFDAIVMHGDSLLAPLTGKPVLRVMHGSAAGEARSATTIGRFVLQSGVYLQELLTASCQNGVVAVSENTRRDNPFVRRVIPHGVDSAIFKPWPESRSTQPSVLFVGSLDGRKRGRFLLDAFSTHVRARHPGATLTMVGSTGPESPGVTHVTGVDDTQLAALYREAWVYASPSTYEGFGLPYLEAMACGTPVVASRNPGSEEVLGDGAYGLMPADSDFADVVSGLLADRERRAELTDAGLHRSQQYSLARMLDGYEGLLLELTEVHADSVAPV
jgi:glycosyltransferase involved in cell wall biosynthesis